MPRRFVLCAALLVAALGGVTAPKLLAQQATPAVGEIIDPSQCQVGPRTIESINQLVSIQGDAAGMATPDLTSIGGLEGEAADQATVDAVTATYRELVACLNAQDYLRIYALYTDDYVRRNLAEQGDLSQLSGTPTPEGGAQTALVGVSNVRTVGDGRVFARVETFDPVRGGTIVIDALLVQQGDRYLIDAEEVTDAPTIDIGTPPADATPALSAAGPATADQYEVVSFDIYFEPDEFSIPAGTDAVVTLPNNGAALHNFAIDELGIDVDIQPGATEQTTINAPAGEYEFYCNVPGHKAAGMVGTLTVE